jgi:glycine hydroxymethyltransferase
MATALSQVATPEFRAYAQQVILNSKALADALTAMGHTIVTGGTDNHLLLWDLGVHGLSSARMERVCELAKYRMLLQLRFYALTPLFLSLAFL